MPLRNDMVRYASNRCTWKTRPAASGDSRDRDRSSIIILGMPPTGTTHLVKMMAAEKRPRDAILGIDASRSDPAKPDTRLAEAEAGWTVLDAILPM